MPYSVIVQNRDGVETHYPFPTVTEILEVLHRPDLTQWYYDVTIEGISKLFQKNASTQGLEFEDLKNALAQSGKSPHSIGHFARARGTSGHKVLENLARRLDPGKVTPSQEWIVKWWNGPDRVALGELIAVEQPVVSFKHRYAGTPDLVFENAVVDLKTTKPENITPERLKHWGLQLDGYATALCEHATGNNVFLNYILHPPGVLVETHYYEVFEKLAEAWWLL